jgi:Spy/CpxP family protein refolding chaperone
MMSKIFIGVSLTTFVLATVFLTGCRKHHSPEARIQWISNEIASRLDLNDTQKKKLKTIEEEIIQRNREMKEVRKEIFELVKAEITKDKIDKEKLNQVLKKNEKKMVDFRYLLVDKAVEFHGVLNPGQKQKIYDKLVKVGQKHGF